MVDDDFACPQCGVRQLNLRDYKSILVVDEDTAIFTVQCPHCQSKLSRVLPIPQYLRSDIEQAASLVNAGMGNTTSDE